MASPRTQSAIIWPSKYLPGTTDNFVTNETIASHLTASQIWSLLSDISEWESYYHNVSQITPPSSGPHLSKGDMFKFSTFGFPVLSCDVEESIAPGTDSGSGGGSDGDGEVKGKGPGRIAWSATLDEGSEDEKVSVYHAWLVEDLDGGRVRILTQESQIGTPARKLAEAKPNRMLLGHQDWIEGLVRKARGEEVKKGETNLGVVEG